MIYHTTTSDDLSFTKEFGSNLSMDAGWVLDWIKDNFTPDQVYGKDAIEDWVKEEYTPEDLFGREVMDKWADDNDYHQAPMEYPEREL